MNGLIKRGIGFIPGGGFTVLAVCLAICVTALLSLHNKRVDAAVMRNDAEWAGKLTAMNSAHQLQLAEAGTRILIDDTKNVAKVAEQNERIRALEEDLEAERKVVPLSGCDACRIPASRVLGRVK